MLSFPGRHRGECSLACTVSLVRASESVGVLMKRRVMGRKALVLGNELRTLDAGWFHKGLASWHPAFRFSHGLFVL